MSMPFYTKRPDEKFTISLDFSDKVPAGVSISSGSCSARRTKTEADATSILLANGTVTVNDNTLHTAAIVVMNGSAGVLYDVIFALNLSDGQKVDGLARVFVDQ